jgi:excisionase family DNA binding protein
MAPIHTPELPFDSVAPVVERRRLLDIDAVAEQLCTSVRHIRRLVQERRIPVVRVRRLVRFDPVDVDAWLDEHHPKVIQHRLGHADPAMSLGVYGHVPDDLDQAAAVRLDGLFRSQVPESASDSS